MRKYIPLYITLALMLVAAILWVEYRETSNADEIKPQEVERPKTRARFWSFLPPVAYVIRK